jgi:hypothetical protein
VQVVSTKVVRVSRLASPRPTELVAIMPRKKTVKIVPSPPVNEWETDDVAASFAALSDDQRTVEHVVPMVMDMAIRRVKLYGTHPAINYYYYKGRMPTGFPLLTQSMIDNYRDVALAEGRGDV